MLALSLNTLPPDWGSVTLSQAAALAALEEGASISEGLAILLGCPPEQLLHLAPRQLDKALRSVLWLGEQPDWKAYPRPKSIFLGGSLNSVEVPVLDTLEDLSFGQAADIGALIHEFGQDVPQLRLKVLATVLQPAYDGTAYDTDRVPVLEVLCQDVTLAEALPLTDFFLPSSTASDGPTPSGSSAFPSAKPSEAPTSGASRKSGIRWPSWMRWPAATRRAGTTSS
ncbi:hypothetical protein DNI29_19105 [Hymenobacter sediminis]|uniref:hypothetical protein n=1 Tax=Hymenobacter sediminis TaxID=2218621 RepID=UPI000DA6BC62|nr:hypothetical protein [Hymenobacter sediminis]RPD45491.1 hypothetical protein DNI29_19105 [Hymenobacter sediminis]